MPNRRCLAWRLSGSVAIAKLLSFRASNLPPWKEGGQGDCPPQADANPMEVYEQKVVSLKRQPFVQPCLSDAQRSYATQQGPLLAYTDYQPAPNVHHLCCGSEMLAPSLG